jgi:nicotinate phosphoribosyltransferase
MSSSSGRPTNVLVTPLLTDLYQITMAYAHWKNNRHEDPAVFELFFRKNPFGGEFTIFAGLDECLKYLESYKFSQSDVDYIKTIPALKDCDPAFFEWLLALDTSQVRVRAVLEGTVVFPRVPLLIVEAPLAIGQLLETTLLTLVNYPSLIATNAARMVLAAAPLPSPGMIRDGTETPPDRPAQCYKSPICVEFGLRRAQGPDGGFSASKYSAIGGFVATSNVQAGKMCGLTVAGTHAHSFIQAYSNLDEVLNNSVVDKRTGNSVPLLPAVIKYRQEMGSTNSRYSTTNDGELAAFIAYASAFPDSFLCLIDTYDTLASGVLNFVLVSLVLDDLGYKPVGIRLDSGDLAYLSMECALTFQAFANKRPFFSELSIVASNDINEAVLHAMNKQEHAITTYGIGTNLVTCQAQPALGCVYKLVEISGKPRMKLSQEISKVLIPGRKKVFRLTGKDERFILDIMIAHHEKDPVMGERILCRHPFIERKRAAVTPSRVEQLDVLVFDGGNVMPGAHRSLDDAKQALMVQLRSIRPDILRYINPTPYKVSVSEDLFTFLHNLWQTETPVAELS